MAWHDSVREDSTIIVKAKLWKSKLLPITSLVAGCLLLVSASWHLILVASNLIHSYSVNLWYALLQTWFLGLAAYLISTGLPKIGEASAVGSNETPRIAWGQILVGTFLIMSYSYNLLHPSHSRFEFMASDEDVEKFTKIFMYSFILVGATLIISGVRARFKKPKEAQDCKTINTWL